MQMLHNTKTRKSRFEGFCSFHRLIMK